MSEYVCNVLPQSLTNAQPPQPAVPAFDNEPLLPPTWNAQAQDDEAQDAQQDDENAPLLPPTLQEMQRREQRKQQRVRGATPTPALENPLLPSQLSVANAGPDEVPLVAPQMKFGRR